MDFSSLLCGRFADSQESHFQTSKRSYIGYVVLESNRSDDIHENTFKLQKVQMWTVSNCKCVYLMIFTNGIFRSRNV